MSAAPGAPGVLIVDDSAVFRRLLARALAGVPGLRVVGSAASAAEARAVIALRRPDVIALDIEMPGEDGLAFLKDQMARDPIPTVVISGLTGRGARTTIAALEAGAIDVAAKPAGLRAAAGPELAALVGGIAQRLRAASAARLMTRRDGAASGFVALPPRPLPPRGAQAPLSAPAGSADWVIALGASTGGVQALTALLTALPADAPPVVVVQHMPEGFTAAFARRLDSLCAMTVREAADGDVLVQGRVLIAPGGACHMEIRREGDALCVRLCEGPPVAYSRPSVDVMLASLAAACPCRVSAAILTGMGSDGAEGLLALRRAGARCFAQDEASSQIYGMPARAWERGGAEAQVALADMAARLMSSVGVPPAARPIPLGTGG